jgi:multidrug efflux pump subunit AcrA (membrane-fusion protein)
MPENIEIELRSEEVQEILNRAPHWLIRWGSIVVFGIILSLFFISWFVEYPDIISTSITITTQTPPEKLLTRNSGKIEAILVNDKQIIAENTPLAVIENAASYKDVFLLKSIIDTLEITKKGFPFDILHSLQLGEVESSFALFQKEYITNELNVKLQPYQVEGAAQTYESIQLRERLNLLILQKEITQGELKLQKNDLERYETLYKKVIIATQELERQKLIYLQA